MGKAWKASNEKAEQWAEAGFNDSAWPTAREVVAFGGGLWGMLAGNVTLSPVKADPFFGHCEVAATDLKNSRVYLELSALAPEIAARVTVNGTSAGGFISQPARLEISRYLKPGPNTLRIEPFAPESVGLVLYPKLKGLTGRPARSVPERRSPTRRVVISLNRAGSETGAPAHSNSSVTECGGYLCGG